MGKTISNYVFLLIIREFLWGIILVFMGTQLFLILLSLVIPASIAIPEHFFIGILALIAFIASIAVILVGRIYWRKRSFLLAFLFSVLFITIYTYIIYKVFRHFVPDLNNGYMPFIWIGYYVIPVIGAIIGFNLRVYKEILIKSNN
ncbi:TPA: hypothetical protein ENS27_11080 [bacterium]|nr:hypothetical protein [bacterium]